MRRYLTIALAILMVTAFTLSAVAVSDPQGEGLQKPKLLLKYDNYVDVGWGIDSTVKTGTCTLFGAGVGPFSRSDESCSPDDAEVELTIDGITVTTDEFISQLRHWEDGAGNELTTIYFYYKHPPFPPGEYTYEVEVDVGCNPGLEYEEDGDLTVEPRKGKPKDTGKP